MHALVRRRDEESLAGTDVNTAPRQPTPDNPNLSTEDSDAIFCVDADTGANGAHRFILATSGITRCAGGTPKTGLCKDCSIGDTPKILTIEVDGKPTKVVGAGCKNGGFYVLRADDGKLLRNTPIYTGPPTEPTAPHDPRILALPSPIGGLQTGCATDGRVIFTNGIDAVRVTTQEKPNAPNQVPTGGRVTATTADLATELWPSRQPKVHGRADNEAIQYERGDIVPEAGSRSGETGSPILPPRQQRSSPSIRRPEPCYARSRLAPSFAVQRSPAVTSMWAEETTSGPAQVRPVRKADRRPIPAANHWQREMLRFARRPYEIRGRKTIETLSMKTILIFATALVCAAHVFAADPTAKKKLTILAIGAHMDDAEGGIGGILISAAEAGHRVVVVVAVSDYSSWRPTIGREAQCKSDQLALAKRFGFELRFLGYPYHNLEANLELKRKVATIAPGSARTSPSMQGTGCPWPQPRRERCRRDRCGALSARAHAQSRREEMPARVLVLRGGQPDDPLRAGFLRGYYAGDGPLRGPPDGLR